MSDADGAAEDCAAGKSVADADACALSVNDIVWAEPNEAAEAVSDG